MAFVKVIGLSGDIKTVPRSMYDSYLKSVGYREINDNGERDETSWDQGQNEPDDSSEHTEEGDYDIESIPISEMNSRQVKEYAKLKDIDISGAKSKEDAKDIIRQWIQEAGA